MIKRLMSILIIIVLVLSMFTGCKKSTTIQANETHESQEQSVISEKQWPHDSLTIIVPYKAGGTNDRQARALAPYIQKVLGVPVKVENRPGGSTTVAYHTHKDKDPDDGSYIIYGHNSAFCTAVIRGEYAYDDFVNLGSMSSGNPVLLVNPKHSDIKDFKDFLGKVKNNPNKYSQPVGPGWGKVFDMVLQSQGLITRAVPVDGGSSDRVMFMSGDVDFYISDYESMVTIADPEEFKVLAVLSEISPYEEFTVANDVMKELGYDITFPNMVTPRYFQVKSEFKEKYPDRFKFLCNALKEAAEDPEFFSSMKEAGYIFDPKLPEEAETVLYNLYQDIVKYKEAF